MTKVVSHLAEVKRLWYKDDCIYLKIYMVNVYIFLLQLKKNNNNIPVTYMYLFFSVSVFLYRIFKIYFFEKCQTIPVHILVVLNSYRILLIHIIYN